MKLLLDENLPIKLKYLFSKNHKIFTVREMGWSGKTNGELLGLMISSGFEGLLTIDKNLKHQQNLEQFKIKIFILDASNNKISTLEPFIDKLEICLSELPNQNVVEISID